MPRSVGKLPRWLHRALLNFAHRRLDTAPDFVIGGDYLLRWWILPRNPLLNVYLHVFGRSDDDRALHDHPWASCSIVLTGGYWEVLPCSPSIPIASTFEVWRAPGAVVVRGAREAHRIALDPGEYCVTLFITGPRVRSWGFWCPRGWRHWKEFTNPKDGGATVGRGCE